MPIICPVVSFPYKTLPDVWLWQLQFFYCFFIQYNIIFICFISVFKPTPFFHLQLHGIGKIRIGRKLCNFWIECSIATNPICTSC